MPGRAEAEAQILKVLKAATTGDATVTWANSRKLHPPGASIRNSIR